MVSTCCVCKRRFDAIVNGKKLSMHRFPKNEEQREAWRKRFNKLGSLKHLLVCSLHFSESESFVVGKRVVKRISLPKDPGIIQKSNEHLTTRVVYREHNYSKVAKVKTLQKDEEDQIKSTNNTNCEQRQRNHKSCSQINQMLKYNHNDSQPNVKIGGYKQIIEIHDFNESQPENVSQPIIEIHRYNDLQPENDLQPDKELQPDTEIHVCNDSQTPTEIHDNNDSQPTYEIIDRVLESLQMQSILKPEEFQEIFALLDDNLKCELTETNDAYSESLKQFAIYLYCYSMKAYRFVQMYLTLPNEDTVKYWLENIKATGINFELHFH